MMSMDNAKDDKAVQHVPGLGIIKQVMYLLPHQLGRELRRLEIQCDVVNRCLVSSTGQEREKWAEAMSLILQTRRPCKSH